MMMGCERPRFLASLSSNLTITSGPRTGTLRLITVVLLGRFAGGGNPTSSIIRQRTSEKQTADPNKYLGINVQNCGFILVCGVSAGLVIQETLSSCNWSLVNLMLPLLDPPLVASFSLISILNSAFSFLTS